MIANQTILQIIPALETGGAERTAVDIADALVRSGSKALVASAGGRLVPEVEAAGAEHITLPMASKNPLVMVANVFRLVSLIRRRNVALLHARSRAPAWSGLIAARLTNIPFVTTYHGSYNQENAVKGWYNSVMARGNTVIANSAYTAGLITERHGFARDRIVVVHRGTDLTAIESGAADPDRIAALARAWRIEPGDKVILNMARLTHWKGQTVLIDALDQLEQAGVSGWTAILAGDDQGRTGYSDDLKQRIKRAGLSDRIRLVGHCDDVAAAMGLAAVSVVASIEPEAFGRAAVEAQAAGKPVIVSNIGAVHETVLAPPECDDGHRTGWHVPAGDAAALAEALKDVLALDETSLAGLADRARRHAAAKFSLDAMTARTLDIYESLIAGRQQGPNYA